jgi:Uncharacterized conserved protein (DUF2190)
MSYEESLRSITLDADASIGIYTGVPGLPGSAAPNYGKQYTFVKVTGAHQAGLAVAATDVIVGVLQNKPQKVGAAATVGISGVTNVISGGPITAGNKVAPDANGKGVVDATNGTCVALATASAADQLIPVLLKF